MDTVSVRSVWTQEANIEADQIINSNKYMFDMLGKNVRTLKNEGIQTLFALTKDPK